MHIDQTIEPQEERRLAGADILANARALATDLRRRNVGKELDELRCLPADVVEQLRAAGIFRMNMPRSWGGPEMTPMQQVEVIEALAYADTSVGWCSFIWADSGIYSSYLDQQVARQMYPRLDMATSGWISPIGQAHIVDGGYRVSGHWIFGSGSKSCDWLAAGCFVFKDGAMVMVDGQPQERVVMAPRDAYQIHETWFTTGLRGTGSNDYSTKDLFVPAERTFSLFDPPQREGPLWRCPDLLLRKMAGIPLGLGRAALDEAVSSLRDKKDRLFPNTPYRDMPRVQTAIAEASAILGAARAYVFTALEAQWAQQVSGATPTQAARADVALSRASAFQAGRRVARLLYDTIGGSAIYSRNPFDRYLRDAETMCQHIVANSKTWEGVGAALLGSTNGPTDVLF